MQKYLFFVALFLPTFTFATTTHIVSAALTSQDSIMGYAIGYSSIFNDRYAFALGHSDASKDQTSTSSTSASFSYGFKPFATGSTYLSIGVADTNQQTVTIRTQFARVVLDASGVSSYAAIGYTKFSGEGLDYDLSLLSMDGETSVNASLRIAMEDSNWGWNLGMANGDSETAVSAGVSVIF